MRKLLGLLVLLAPALLAETTPEKAPPTPFPADYQRSPCAPKKACRPVPQSTFAEIAALRGSDIGQEWVDAHWTELVAAIAPACERIATCFTVAGNDHLFCNDIATEEITPVCSRYPDGSEDRKKCVAFTAVYMASVDSNSLPLWTEAQACAKAAQTTAPAQRTLKYWMSPGQLDLNKPATYRVYTLDSVTGVSVLAKLLIDSKQPIYAEDSPDGTPTSFYKVPWKPSLIRVPNARGRRDLVAPKVRIVAQGYREETFMLPVAIPVMKVNMNPPAKKLKRGKNTVTITARDAATGQPVEARVMGDSLVLGKTNEPFELVLARGKKQPEIWVTSLYDRYQDVVVAPAAK